MLKRMIGKTNKFIRGKRIYECLHDKGWLIILNDAIGEFIFTSAYIPAFIDEYSIKKYTLVTLKRLSELSKLYPFYSDIIVLDKIDIDSLCIYLSGKDPWKYHVINSLWKDSRTYKIKNKVEKDSESKWVLPEICARYMGVSDAKKICHPIPVEISNALANSYGIVPNKTIILNPVANTCKMLDPEFWLDLANELYQYGFYIVFNAEDKYNSGNFPKILPSLELIPGLVKYAGGVISIQCGLSDLLIESDCNVHVIFCPQEDDNGHYRFSNEGIPFEVPVRYIIEENADYDVKIKEILDNFVQ